MEFAIMTLKAKRDEIDEEYRDKLDKTSIIAYHMMREDLCNAIRMLEEEHWWKPMREHVEKQLNEHSVDKSNSCIMIIPTSKDFITIKKQ